MDISTSTFITKWAQSTSAAASKTSQNDEEFGVQTEGRKSVDDIFSQYDFANISPREIDQLAEELRENDHQPDGLLMLLTYGEEYQAHLSASVGYPKPPEAFTQKMNLLEHVQQQMDNAIRFGDPIEGYKEVLDLIQGQQTSKQKPAAPSFPNAELVRSTFG